MKPERKRVTLLNWNEAVIVVRWAFMSEEEAADFAGADSENEGWQILDGWVVLEAKHVQEEPS